MKKNYTSPAIETTEVMVEAGIAFSTMEATCGLEDAAYSVEDVAW